MQAPVACTRSDGDEKTYPDAQDEITHVASLEGLFEVALAQVLEFINARNVLLFVTVFVRTCWPVVLGVNDQH